MLNEPQANTQIIQELAEIKAQISQLQTHIQQPEQPTIVQALSNLKLQLSQLTDELTLVSHASGMDYRNLQQLLSAQNWQDADKETYAIMLKISERENVCWLDDGDIRKFPRYDLHIINQLWVKYSDGKFGFSIQKQILQDHKQFTARCGWIEDIAKNELIKYEDYNFTLEEIREGKLISKLSSDLIQWDTAKNVWRLESWRLRVLKERGEEYSTGNAMDTVLSISPADFARFYLSASTSILFLILSIFKAFCIIQKSSPYSSPSLRSLFFFY
jgi:hypothetical protein